MMDLSHVAAENARLKEAVTLLGENQRLRAQLAAAGIRTPDGASSPRIYMVTLAELMAAYHGVSVTQLRGPDRARSVSHPRQHFMWVARQHIVGDRHRWSLPEIGRFLGGRDHTTVLHGVRAHEARRTVDDPFLELLAEHQRLKEAAHHA